MPLTLSDSDVEFLAARVRRLCKAFGYPGPDQNNEFVVGVAGSLIGGLLSRLEGQEPIAWACWADGFSPTECAPQLLTYEPQAYPQRIPLMKQPPKPKKFGEDNIHRAAQAVGMHPAPCARHCEATAFEIEIRRLKASHDALVRNLDLVAKERDELLAKLKELEGQEPSHFIDERGKARIYTPSDFNQCEYGGLSRLYSRRVPAEPVQLTEEQVKKADEAIREALCMAYDCMRVWEAWSVGTMCADDFWPVADDDTRVAEIRDAVAKALGFKVEDA